MATTTELLSLVWTLTHVNQVTNCFMTLQPVPRDLVSLSDAIGETQDEENRAASKLINLFARMCNLLASNQMSPPVDSTHAIAEAVCLDDNLNQWTSELPIGLARSIEPALPSAKAYSDYCEIYSTIFSAEVWLLYRTARMGVNGLLVSIYGAMFATQSTPEAFSPREAQSTCQNELEVPTALLQMQECLGILESVRSDICAAVPFLLGLHGPQPKRVNDLPLGSRTLVVKLLSFFTKTSSVPEQMCAWATWLLGELQGERDIDKGAIWMSVSPASCPAS